MYVAHSKLTPQITEETIKVEPKGSSFSERYNHHLFEKACLKFHDRIKAIQEQIPGWTPVDPNK